MESVIARSPPKADDEAIYAVEIASSVAEFIPSEVEGLLPRNDGNLDSNDELL